MAQIVDRRTMLKRSALGAGGLAVVGFGGSSLLAACGGDDSDSSSSGSSGGGGSLGTLDLQLSWVKNVEFAGEYIADSKDYWIDEGFDSVNLIAGGPNVSPDTVIAAGSALVAISDPSFTSPAILEGAPIVSLGALYQTNPFAIMSMADTPISSPEELIGKSIGIQAVNEPLWAAFLQANEIDASEINAVPVQFDPLPLTTGEVDAWLSFFTNEPNLLRTEGFEVEVFKLSDFNYPLVSEIVVVRKDSLEEDRDKIKAFLIGDIKGWRDSYVDPAEGAVLAVEEYGADLGLNVEEQTLESGDQNTLIFTPDTLANGIYTITDELLEEAVNTLSLGGIEITSDELFDLSLITEIYEENPDLMGEPT